LIVERIGENWGKFPIFPKIILFYFPPMKYFVPYDDCPFLTQQTYWFLKCCGIQQEKKLYVDCYE